MPARLALIGTGRWGAKIGATLRTLPSCELVYEAARDWRDLLEKKIDGVIIATPPASHAEIALAFIERGVPVFVEKPMTLSLTDADAIVTASEQQGVPVMVGHIHLYNTAYEAMKAELASIGTLQSIEGTESHDGPMRKDYSTLWDSMPHDLSMMLDLVGMPATVAAEGTALSRPGTRLYDRACMRLTFPGGTTGSITSDWIGPEKVRRFKIIGERGSLLYDDVLKEHKVIRVGSDDTRSYPSYASEWPLTRELSAFIEMVRNGTVPRSDAQHGRAVVRILEAAERSITLGNQPIRL